MSIEEDVIQKLQDVYDVHQDDPEMAHYEADYILKSVLIDLGYSRIVNEYNAIKNKVGFYYA